MRLSGVRMGWRVLLETRFLSLDPVKWLPLLETNRALFVGKRPKRCMEGCCLPGS